MYPNIITNAFKAHFGESHSLLVRAPGRINLIGEHTDYNGGFVLPAAIDKAIYFAVSKRNDQECHFFALDLNEKYITNLSQLSKTQTQTWANYLMGVLVEIQKTHDEKLGGFNLVFGGDLPNGFGISSSAAVENGIGFAINELFELNFSLIELVKISQRAENNFVGMNCGIMDMFASMMGRKNTVIRLDCRSLEYEYFPFDAPDYCLVLCNSMVKHSLVDSEYNTRRAECEEGVAILQQYDASIQTLRDVEMAFLQEHKNQLREVVFRRCKYVVEEIERVENACNSLKTNDLKTFGQAMFATHEGLKNEYEVSCVELDFLVETAKKFLPKNAVLGARMMGGGFGGCTINLVNKKHIEAFIEYQKNAYFSEYQIVMQSNVVILENGVEQIF